MEHRWNNVHKADCQVVADRMDLLAQLVTDPDNGFLLGAVPEYDDGGDQEVELCTCGFFLLVDAFNRWDSAVRDHAELYEEDPNSSIIRVVAAAGLLCGLLMDTPRTNEAVGWKIMREVTEHTGALLWGYFSDSTLDATCDIEWDLHMLQAVLHPGYQVPEEVWPAYVIGTVFDGPQEA